MKKLLLAVFLPAVVLAGCSKGGDGDDATPPDTSGKVTGVVITPSGDYLRAVRGTDVQLSASVEPASAAQGVLWKVTPEEWAEVDGTGKVQIAGIAEFGGTLTVTATSTADLTVKAIRTLTVSAAPDADYFSEWEYVPDVNPSGNWYTISLGADKFVYTSSLGNGYTLEGLAWVPITPPPGSYATTYPSGYRIIGTLTARNGNVAWKADESGAAQTLGERCVTWLYIHTDRKTLMSGTENPPHSPNGNKYSKAPWVDYYGTWKFTNALDTWFQVTITPAAYVFSNSNGDGYTFQNLVWTAVDNPGATFTDHPTGYKVAGKMTALIGSGPRKADDSGLADVNDIAADWWYIHTDKSSLRIGLSTGTHGPSPALYVKQP